ncbi:E3 ubiquitin-protein ligase [Canna indica]|uniref:E3 ubiquitin-protein ligase n=1 Tax=Canna indica TaxID=4628 RepID=A0AAQ3L731_9LILI|nr:E3 ubiquitin-protein ligase [Canna indica]
MAMDEIEPLPLVWVFPFAGIASNSERTRGIETRSSNGRRWTPVPRKGMRSTSVIDDEESSEEIRELDNDEDEARDVEWEFLLAVNKLDNDEVEARDVEWEFLLTVNSLGRNTLDLEDVEPYFVDEPDSEAYEAFTT